MKKEYMPLYIRIKTDIINRIMSGELKKSDKLPTERELAETFNVSRVTVVGALRELSKEGIILKRRGSGSYVNRDAFDEDYEDIFSHVCTPPEKTITFGIYKPSPEYHIMMSTMAGLFQLENPGIRVKIIPVFPPADYRSDAYLELLGKGEAPTAGEFFFHADYAAINALLPLEEMPGFAELQTSLRPHCSNLTPDASGEKHVHALAIRVNSRVIIVNCKMLADAGIDIGIEHLTKDMLLEWIVRLGEKYEKSVNGEYGLHLEMPFGWHGVTSSLPYLWGNASEIENSCAGLVEILRRTDFLEGLKFLSEIYRRGKPAPKNGIELFDAGLVGMIVSSTPWPLILNDLMSDKTSIKAFQIPSLNGSGPARSVIGDLRVGIFRASTKNQAETDAAWRWLKFLFRKKIQYFQGTDLAFPALKNIPSRIEKFAPQASAVFSEALKTGVPQFDFKNQRTAMTVLGMEMKRCFSRAGSAEVCRNNAVSLIKEIART